MMKAIPSIEQKKKKRRCIYSATCRQAFDKCGSDADFSKRDKWK